MHKADLIELANEIRVMTRCRKAEIHVASDGILAVGVWGAPNDSYTIINGWEYSSDKRPIRTPEDAIEAVINWIDRRPSKMTAADLGLPEPAMENA